MKIVPLTIILCFSKALSGCTQDIRIAGNYYGQKVNTVIDSELAAYYFNKTQDSTIHDVTLEKKLLEVLPSTKYNALQNEEFEQIAKNASVDLATLCFIEKAYKVPENQCAQNTFFDFLQKEATRSLLQSNKANEYVYVFVPGLFYKRHPETGGDFAAQRKQLQNMGLTTYLIATNEIGPVQENAQIIATELRRISGSHAKIIVVSASKGGPDLACALGKTMTHEECKCIKAWVSIGGVLRGSQIADDHTWGIKRLYAKVIVRFIGAHFSFIEDLTRKKSIPRYNSLNLPKELLIIHYVGAPLSSQVNKNVKSNHKRLSEWGPNDGLTTLMDELTPQGIIITALGLDHYYKDPNIDKKTIAMLFTALELLEKS